MKSNKKITAKTVSLTLCAAMACLSLIHISEPTRH